MQFCKSDVGGQPEANVLDWQDLQVFLEVARHPRLADAARRLGVDHSTLSRRTRRFEQRLNTQLFERST
ncbi:MAG: LysR family transcriptional regulator, partial [Pseudomonadota bacterium]|nr:LysR family transcriptional regulator [Pseudomonadota bacterium]